MESIFGSRWATDAYKYSMGEVFWLNFKGVWVRYEFEDRQNLPYLKNLAEEIKNQLEMFVGLPAAIDRAEYMKKIWGWMNWDYLLWYANLKFDISQVNIEVWHNKLKITVEGPVEEATFWEILILRAYSCVYTYLSGKVPDPNWLERLEERAKFYYDEGIGVVEGGGRRPFSAQIHWEVDNMLYKYRQTKPGGGGFMGTSWVENAFQLGVMQFGTQAHEYTSFMGGYFGHANANKMALQYWVPSYGRRLGYVLPDSLTSKHFLKDFVFGYADIFSGARNDSMEPYQFTYLFTDPKEGHWPKLGIDIREKSIIYSNGPYTDAEVLALNNYRKGEYGRSFLQWWVWTNNVGHKPYICVAKIKAVRLPSGIWVNTVKIPDNPEKMSGDPEEVKKVVHDLELTW